jgi:hypothetical protein
MSCLGEADFVKFALLGLEEEGAFCTPVLGRRGGLPPDFGGFLAVIHRSFHMFFIILVPTCSADVSITVQHL